MSQTLSNILVHVVFHKKTSVPAIREDGQHRLNRFVQRTCENLKCHCLIANGPSDHLHLLVALSPEVAVAQLVKEVKRTATGFLKECDTAYYHDFYWQTGMAFFRFRQIERRGVRIHRPTEGASPKAAGAK